MTKIFDVTVTMFKLFWGKYDIKLYVQCTYYDEQKLWRHFKPQCWCC